MNIRILVLLVVFLTSLGGFALAKPGKQKTVQTAVIKTSIYCDHCKICESCGGRLLKELYNKGGIKSTDVDPKKNTITVVYDSKKLTLDKVREMISQLGFDADHIKADPQAVARLDDCCRKA